MKAVYSSLSHHSHGKLLSLQHTIYPFHPFNHGGVLKLLPLLLADRPAATTHLKVMLSLAATVAAIYFCS